MTSEATSIPRRVRDADIALVRERVSLVELAAEHTTLAKRHSALVQAMRKLKTKARGG